MRGITPFGRTGMMMKRKLSIAERRNAWRLPRADRGAAAVEFGIIAMPFFLLLCAIFQTGLLFFEQQVFQTAVNDAARLIFTGQAQASGTTQAQFKQKICDKLPGFISCSSIAVDVRPFTSFSDAQATKPTDSSGNYDPTKAQYSIGSEKSIVVISAYAQIPVLFPIMNSSMSNAGNGRVLITATAAFRNEPWGE